MRCLMKTTYFSYKSEITVGECLRTLFRIFSKSKISEPKQSAGYIVAHALNKKSISFCDRKASLSENNMSEISKMVKLRLTHFPLQYIVGGWDFCDVDLILRPPVFIPRPETEEFVENVLKSFSNHDCPKFLEVGCGSGAISLSLLSRLVQAQSHAIDINPAACDLTLQNARKNKLDNRITVSNKSFDEFQKNFDGNKYDFLISNPPYVPTAEMSILQKEILFEDFAALDGGHDGLDVIRKILLCAPKLVKDNGSVWLEIDTSHEQILPDLISQLKEVKLVSIINDFTNRPRFCHVKIQSSDD